MNFFFVLRHAFLEANVPIIYSLEEEEATEEVIFEPKTDASAFQVLRK